MLQPSWLSICVIRGTSFYAMATPQTPLPFGSRESVRELQDALVAQALQPSPGDSDLNASAVRAPTAPLTPNRGIDRAQRLTAALPADQLSPDEAWRSFHALAEHDIRPYLRAETWAQRVARRLLTVPVLVLAALLWVALAPLLLPLFLLADVVMRRPLLWSRFYVAVAAILLGQVYGIGGLLVIWCASGFGHNYRRNNAWTAWFSGHWAKWNGDVMARCYNMQFHVEGGACLRHGPTILLSRHASIIDTILPISLITQRQGVRLRIVLKHELLFSATVDAIGHRVPTAFVRRESNNLDNELQAIKQMTGAMHAEEAVLIFPEGTRFTEEKRDRVLARLRSKDPVAHARAAQLQHVLPMRPAGLNALMAALPHADLVFCAHTGLERAGKLAHFFSGALYGAQVHVKYWRVRAYDVPAESEARAAFLFEQWQKVDAYIATRQARDANLA